MNIMQIFKRFPDQAACVEHLESARWGDTPKCPYCESDNTNPLKNELRHHCNGCRKSFSVTVGTIFHHTHLPLQKWFLAISLIMNAKKGIASRQLGRDLELPVKTAWFLNMRIRKAMIADSELLHGIIEMDETYIGGKPRQKNDKTDKSEPFPRCRHNRAQGQRPGRMYQGTSRERLLCLLCGRTWTLRTVSWLRTNTPHITTWP